MSIRGLHGRPFINLERYVDLAALTSLDREICEGLARVPVDYTGGSHRSMGIMPPSCTDEALVDYGEVIARFDRAEFAAFVALSDDPSAFDLDQFQDYEFGEERDHPLNRRQMLFLKYRHGVYFPWKVYYELIPNLRWEEKSRAEGKSFTGEALRFFPRTIDFIRRLPFASIGRCILLGLEANDHGTVHRDGDPDVKTEVDEFITLCPRKNKRLFLWDEERREKSFIDARAFWWNDSDYHGVERDPFFRYSLRVDGIFRDDFRAKVTGGISP